MKTTSERFWEKVSKTETCWLWTAATNGSSGRYGAFRPGSSRTTKTVKAHRWAWEERNGPIPCGMEIDHLCRNLLCVNPSHMEVVIHKTNMERMGAVKTHCKQGHEFTDENTLVSAQGHRYCKTCRRERDRLRGLVRYGSKDGST